MSAKATFAYHLFRRKQVLFISLLVLAMLVMTYCFSRLSCNFPRPNQSVSCILWADAGLLCIQTNYWYRYIEPIPGTNWILQITKTHRPRFNLLLERFGTVSIDSMEKSLFVLLGPAIRANQQWSIDGNQLKDALDFCQSGVENRKHFMNEGMSGEVSVRVKKVDDNIAILNVSTSIVFFDPAYGSGYQGRFYSKFDGKVKISRPNSTQRVSEMYPNWVRIHKW